MRGGTDRAARKPEHWVYPSRAATAFPSLERGISISPTTKHAECGIGSPGHSTIALVAQQSADRRGGHYAHSHDASWDRMFGRSWHGARLFRSADGSFNSGFTVNSRSREYGARRVATDGGIALTLRRSHTRRGLCDESGAVLRHVCGQRPVANERTVPAVGRRPNRVRSWPTRVSGWTVVGRFEWKRHSRRRGPLLPLSAPATGTVDTVDQTCSARGADGASRAEHFVKKQADEDTLYAAWTVAEITL